MPRVPKLLSALFTSAALCVSPHIAAAQTSEPIRIAYHDAPHQFNPAYASNTSTLIVMVNLYETLIRDSHQNGVMPGLAEKWEISEDNRVYDFWIRDNAKWSDGTGIDADYVVQSFQTLANLPDTKNFVDFTEIEISVAERANGDEVVRFTLPEPSTRFFSYLTIIQNAVLPIHKQDVLDLATPWKDWQPEHFVYSGPYVIDQINMEGGVLGGGMVEFSPNPYFYDSSSIKNSGIAYNILPGENDRHALAAIGNSEIDLAFLRASGLSEFLNTSMTEYLRYHEVSAIDQLLFNVESDKLQDPEIRRILASVTDLSHGDRFVENNNLIITRSFLPAAMRDNLQLKPSRASDHSLAEIIDNAREAMEARGFNQENPLKIRYAINISPTHESIANLIRSRFARIHVDAEIVQRPWSDHLIALEAGEFDVARYGWRYDIAHPANLMESYTSGNAFNYTGFRHERFDQIIAAMDTAHGIDEMKALVNAAEELLEEETPAAPVYQRAPKPILAQTNLRIGDRTFMGFYRFEDIHRELLN